MTCKKIEKLTKEAISKIQNTEFKTVNTDEKDNKHYLTDYSLYTKSVVLVDDKGNWKNLDKIWLHIQSDDNFKQYVIDETKAFMEKK